MCMNIASFTKDRNAVKQFTTWYDGTPFCKLFYSISILSK